MTVPSDIAVMINAVIVAGVLLPQAAAADEPAVRPHVLFVAVDDPQHAAAAKQMAGALAAGWKSAVPVRGAPK